MTGGSLLISEASAAETFEVSHGGATVEAHRQLDPHERQAVFHALEKTFSVL